MAILQAFENSEFRIIQELMAFENSEFHLSNEILGFENSEFKLTVVLESFENSEFFLFAAEVYDTLTFSTPTTEYLQYIQPVTYIRFIFNNTDYSPYVKSLKFHKNLGGKTYADITLIEFGNGNIVDFINDIGAGVYYDKIISQQPTKTNPIHGSYCAYPLKYHGYSPDRYGIIQISTGYHGQSFQTYSSPYLLPSEVSFDGTECNVKLEDFTVLLEQEHVSMTPDIDADHGVIKYAHAAIKEVAVVYKYIGYVNTIVGYLNVVCSFPDYLIRLLRRTQSKPLNWIDMIARIYQAKRSWVGNTLHLTPVMTADEQPAKWTLNASKHIIEGSIKIAQNLSDYKNKYTIIRTSPNGGVIGEQECIGYDCPGRTGNITFDFPVNFAAATVEVTYGLLEAFVYFTGSDTVVGGSPINAPSGLSIMSAVPVSNVKFTYRPRIGATPLQPDGTTLNAGNFIPGLNNLGMFPYMPRYKVTYRGYKNPSNSMLDTDYKFTGQDADGIACLGLHEEYSDIEDPIIPNSGVAAAYVSALLKEHTRKVLVQSLETPFVNPFIEPGDCIAITDYETNQNGLKWIVEEISINIDGNDSTMELNLTRGRT